GLGLDEDTAAIISSEETLEVIGRGAVTIVDGSQVVTDAFQTKGHRPMMVSGAILHSLPSGYRFDLRSRALVPFAVDSVAPETSPRETARARLRRLARRAAAEGADDRVVSRRRAREEPRASE
ncbi:MAG TPA: cyanophycinase, partial [Actinomycetota bacterium]